MALAASEFTGALMAGGARRASSLMDDLYVAMQSEMSGLEMKLQTYLRWYSPPYSDTTKTHDAWPERITYEDIDTTRSNFPICRAVVDIWSSLEAASPPSVRAEPERIPPPLPILDPAQAQMARQQFTPIKGGKS